VAWYRFKKKISLVPAMLHGDKSLPEPVTASKDQVPQRLLAFVLLILSALAVYFLVSIRP
jgi:hypothetical protein